MKPDNQPFHHVKCNLLTAGDYLQCTDVPKLMSQGLLRWTWRSEAFSRKHHLSKVTKQLIYTCLRRLVCLMCFSVPKSRNIFCST